MAYQRESAGNNERNGGSKIADMRDTLNVVTKQFESIANRMTNDGRANMTDMQLFRHIGRCVVNQHTQWRTRFTTYILNINA